MTIQSFVAVSFSGEMLQRQGFTPFPSQELWEEIQEYLADKVQEEYRVMLFLDNDMPNHIQVGVFNPDETQETAEKRLEQCCVLRPDSEEGIQYYLPA